MQRFAAVPACLAAVAFGGFRWRWWAAGRLARYNPPFRRLRLAKKHRARCRNADPLQRLNGKQVRVRKDTMPELPPQRSASAGMSKCHWAKTWEGDIPRLASPDTGLRTHLTQVPRGSGHETLGCAARLVVCSLVHLIFVCSPACGDACRIQGETHEISEGAARRFCRGIGHALRRAISGGGQRCRSAA